MPRYLPFPRHLETPSCWENCSLMGCWVFLPKISNFWKLTTRPDEASNVSNTLWRVFASFTVALQGKKNKHSKWWSGRCWGSVYQNYPQCNVKDFSLFNIIPIITYIYSYTLAMIPHKKESNLPNSSPNPLRDKPAKLHYKYRCIKHAK